MKHLLAALLLVSMSALVAPVTASAQWNTVDGVFSRSDTIPVAAEFNGKLWIFFQRTLDRQVGYVTTTNIDGGPGTFSAETILPTGAFNPQPAAVVFDNRLYLFYADGGSPYRLFYRSIGTTGTWTLEQQVPNVSTQQKPGLAVFNNQLYIFWDPSGSDNRIKYVTMSSTGSFSGVLTPYGKTTRGPTATVYNGRLYVVYTGESGPPWDLYYVSMGSSGTWSSHYAVGGSPRSESPISAVAPFRGLLQTYYTVYASYPVPQYRLMNRTLNTNGSWSAEYWVLGLGANQYGISAANFNVRQWVFAPGYPDKIWYIVLQ